MSLQSNKHNKVHMQNISFYLLDLKKVFNLSTQPPFCNYLIKNATTVCQLL